MPPQHPPPACPPTAAPVARRAGGRSRRLAAIRDRRVGGIAGPIAASLRRGPVLVVADDALLRARHLSPILGGFELCSHEALERPASRTAHHVVCRPTAGPLRASAR